MCSSQMLVTWPADSVAAGLHKRGGTVTDRPQLVSSWCTVSTSHTATTASTLHGSSSCQLHPTTKVTLSVSPRAAGSLRPQRIHPPAL